MKPSSIIITALFVGAGGIIAGSLFAPGKGSKTRKKMVRKGHLYKDYLMNNFYDFADSVSHPFENLEKKQSSCAKKPMPKRKRSRLK